jgi:DnaJ-domain-containing protein 1
VPFPSNIQIDQEKKRDFYLMLMVYRIALAFVMLEQQRKKNERFELVGQALKTKLDEQLSKAEFSLAVTNAKKKLEELLFSDSGKELTWSREWLDAIGIEVLNPSDLTFFAVGWLDAYAALLETGSSLNPT